MFSQREVATRTPDLPHAYEGPRAFRGVCLVCGADRDDPRHVAQEQGLQHPRERADAPGGLFSVREHG
jgi:hypothetical protein